jgi:hypothetical protein
VELPDDLGRSLFTNDACEGFERSLDIVPGDRYLEDNFPDSTVGFIKADVEGFEPNVFRGLKRTLIRDRPIIMFENSSRDSAVIDILKEYGYTKFYGFEENCIRFRNTQVKRFCRILNNRITVVEVKDPSMHHYIIASC